jgi:hypothetical protein
VLATEIGGVPEATPGRTSLVAPGAQPATWWRSLQAVLAELPARSAAASNFSRPFTSIRSAERILDLAARAVRNRPEPQLRMLRKSEDFRWAP